MRMTRFPVNSFAIIIRKTSSSKKRPVDFTSTINFEFLYFLARFLAINKPILSENISLPFSSITPHLSPSPSNPNLYQLYYL